jgi:hypothetical protein
MAARSPTPDLFSLTSARAASSPATPAARETSATSNVRHILPDDLPNAIKQLEDHEFDRLLSAVLAEQKRRRKTFGEPNATSHKRLVKTAASSLTAGKVNAIHAAFKAGIRPPQICANIRTFPGRCPQSIGIRCRETITPSPTLESLMVPNQDSIRKTIFLASL